MLQPFWAVDSNRIVDATTLLNRSSILRINVTESTSYTCVMGSRTNHTKADTLSVSINVLTREEYAMLLPQSSHTDTITIYETSSFATWRKTGADNANNDVSTICTGERLTSGGIELSLTDDDDIINKTALTLTAVGRNLNSLRIHLRHGVRGQFERVDDVTFDGSTLQAKDIVVRSVPIYLSFSIREQDTCASLASVRLWEKRCGEITFGLSSIEPKSVPHGSSAELHRAECSDGASIIPGIRANHVPTRYCTASGVWETGKADTKGEMNMSMCMCESKEANIQLGASHCIESPGPLCYTCDSVDECAVSERTVQCIAHQRCFTRTIVDRRGVITHMQRGCAAIDSDTCMSTIGVGCLDGSDGCEMCCNQDLCNFLPVAPLTTSPTPQTITLRVTRANDDNDDEELGVWTGGERSCEDIEAPVFLNCPTEALIVHYAGPEWSEPFDLPDVQVRDNSGFYRLNVTYNGDSSQIRQPMYVTEGGSLEYTAVDQKGNVERCHVKVELIDRTPPVVECPLQPVTSTLDRMPSLGHVIFDGSDVTVSDDHQQALPKTSAVPFLNNKPVGSFLAVNKWYTVVVTAFDTSKNIANCTYRFRYYMPACHSDSAPIGCNVTSPNNFPNFPSVCYTQACPYGQFSPTISGTMNNGSAEPLSCHYENGTTVWRLRGALLS